VASTNETGAFNLHAAPPTAGVRVVRFVKPWCSTDRRFAQGYCNPGELRGLPSELAVWLVAQHVVEYVETEESGHGKQ
jgi:hypothetical protein